MSADVLYAVAVGLTALLGLMVGGRKQREAEGITSVDWRCRLGLHRWKPIVSPPRMLGDGCRAYLIVGRKCSRCGKRA